MKSNILRSIENKEDGTTSHAFWCPGCVTVHIFYHKWKFNGDFKKPTFSPSLLCFVPEHEFDGEVIPRETLCHLFVVDGNIIYCGDSPHKLAGKTIPMEPIPFAWNFHDKEESDN